MSTINLRRAVRSQFKSYREIDWEYDVESSTTDDSSKPSRQQPTRKARLERKSSFHDEVAYMSDSDTQNNSSSRRPTARNTHVRADTYATRRTIPFRSAKRLKRSHDSDENGSPSFPAQMSSGRRALRRKDLQRRKAKNSNDVAISQQNSVASLKDSVARDMKRDKASQTDRCLGSTNEAKSSSSPHNPSLFWQNLPHHILVSIMQMAAFPLYADAFKDTGGMRWLLNTSELCRAFHDACIEVLMENPPLLPSHRAHHVLGLLRACQHYFDGPSPTTHEKIATRGSIPDQPSLDYRNRIKTLSIEVRTLLVLKAGIPLDDLIRLTPLLKHLRLVHSHDALANNILWATPGRDSSSTKWSYEKDNVFQVLDSMGTRLESFEWNGRFMRDDPELTFFAQHSLTAHCLRGLRSLGIHNFLLYDAEQLIDLVDGLEILEDSRATTSGLKRAQLLISWRQKVLEAMDSLPRLQDLTLHTCNIFDETTITRLPSKLKRLRLVNLPFVNSEGVSKYLTEQGSTLHNLELHGNQSLSLGFMATLKQCAPQLKEIDIDMTYHDPSAFHDTDPFFDELLPQGPPSWPTSLQSVSIGPLRMPSSEEAESFYQTLIDAAPELPYLRILVLRTFLKQASWRDRASLRPKWITKLNEAFSVTCNPTVAFPRAGKAGQQQATKRRVERTSRKQGQEKVLKHQTGRCHTLIFELSDQRPAAQQWREADFLDSEPEGDEEWIA